MKLAKDDFQICKQARLFELLQSARSASDDHRLLKPNRIHDVHCGLQIEN